MKLTSAKTDFVNLPLRVDSAFLAKHHREGEPTVLAKVACIGNTAPYEYRGHGARSYVLRWDLKLSAHALRIPLHIWMQKDHALAHDLLEHDSRPLPIVVLFEMPPPPPAPAPEPAAVPASRPPRAKRKRRAVRRKGAARAR